VPDRRGLVGEAPLHPHQVPRHAVVVREPQERQPAGAQPGLGLGLRPERIDDAGRHPLDRAVDADSEEAVLAVEELVDDRLGHPCAAAELVHRSPRVAPLGEQLLGQLDELALAHGARHAAVLEVLDTGGGLHLPPVGYRE
jgi:hypothetical protein